jgi:DNA-damage-inducible protein J
MSTTRISVNIDEKVKQDALRVFGEIGMDMTTAIDSFLRTVAREERIPFDLCTAKAYREAARREYISVELDKSITEASDPNTKRVSHEELMGHLKRRREARKNV